jgi:hypothetical protein
MRRPSGYRPPHTRARERERRGHDSSPTRPHRPPELRRRVLSPGGGGAPAPREGCRALNPRTQQAGARPAAARRCALGGPGWGRLWRTSNIVPWEQSPCYSEQLDGAMELGCPRSLRSCHTGQIKISCLFLFQGLSAGRRTLAAVSPTDQPPPSCSWSCSAPDPWRARRPLSSSEAAEAAAVQEEEGSLRLNVMWALLKWWQQG